jgi:hypothetical protein
MPYVPVKTYELDIHCHGGCGKTTKLTIQLPRNDREASDRKVERSLRRRGWAGTNLMTLVCPACNPKETQL